MPIANKPVTIRRGTAVEDLLRAAASEFNEVGYHGTDTNRIARRAGYAPQTFYRNFDSKVHVFVAVYEAWQAREQRAVRKALDDSDTTARDAHAATVLIASHRRWRGFRRSLRLLALEDAAVRAARTKSRLAQLQLLQPASAVPPTAARVAALLVVERLCDAAADDEVRDLAIGREAWLAIVADAFARLRTS